MMNILEAKTSLSKLVASVESGEVSEVIIARNGKPAARLVPIEKMPKVRIGLFEGQYVIPDGLDQPDEDIARLFNDSHWNPGPASDA